MPFLAVYLEDVGIRGSTKAIVLSMFPVGAFLSGPIWGYVADRVSQARHILILASFLGAACSWMAVLTQKGPWLLVALLLFSICQSPLVTLVDATAVQVLAAQPHSYGRVRLWGSVAYIGTVWVVGELIDVWPIISLLLSATMLTSAAMLTLLFPSSTSTSRPPTSSLLGTLRELWQLQSFRVIWWLGTAQCLALAIYNYLFALHIKQMGLPPHSASLAITLGIILEVFIMAIAPSLLQRYGASLLFLIALAAGIPRWFVTGWSSSAFPMIAIQILHGLVFGLWWVTSISLLAHHVPAHFRYFAQSIFMLTAQGIGPILAMTLAYLTLDTLSTHSLFLFSFGLSFLALLYAWKNQKFLHLH